MRTLSKRLSRIPPYPFVVIAEQIRQLQARGVDVIRMDIGAPDMPPPEQVIDALAEEARRPDVHGYPGYRGSPQLKSAFAEYYQRRFAVELDPAEEVLPLIGSKEGLYHLTQAYVDPGDVVIIPDPAYPTYRMAALFAGGEIYTVSLKAENGYLPDLNDIPESVLRRTKLFWINYPNNPTGATASLSFFQEVIALARRWDFLVCHDAPYVDVTYDNYIAPSILQVPGAKDVAVEFNSLSKSYNMAGWRVGVAVGSSDAIKALLRMKSNVDSGIFLPIQHAAAVALRQVPQTWIKERNQIYAHRRDMLVDALRRLGLNVQSPRAALYVWVRVPEGFTGRTFADRLLQGAGVSVAPGDMYGTQGADYVRISLGVPTDRVEEAIQRITRLLA